MAAGDGGLNNHKLIYRKLAFRDRVYCFVIILQVLSIYVEGSSLLHTSLLFLDRLAREGAALVVIGTVARIAHETVSTTVSIAVTIT